MLIKKYPVRTLPEEANMLAPRAENLIGKEYVLTLISEGKKWLD
jgi:hypothetical protein